MTIYRSNGGKFASKAEIAAIKAATTKQPRETLIAYKGFYSSPDGTLACRGFKFEVGKEYNISETPEPCYRGFHACENPFDMFSFYALNPENIFGRVKLLGPIVKSGNKHAAKGIIVEEFFHMAHLINVLAKYARDNPSVADLVNLNKQKANPSDYKFDISTEYKGYTNAFITNYGYQLSTVAGESMYHHGYAGVQIGAADGQVMFSSGTMQISAGNKSYVTNDHPEGIVDIRGKNNVVRLLKAGAKFRGVLGTRFELIAFNGQPHEGVVGENGVAPGKWVSIQRTSKPIVYEYKLHQAP